MGYLFVSFCVINADVAVWMCNYGAICTMLYQLWLFRSVTKTFAEWDFVRRASLWPPCNSFRFIWNLLTLWRQHQQQEQKFNRRHSIMANSKRLVASTQEEGIVNWRGLRSGGRRHGYKIIMLSGHRLRLSQRNRSILQKTWTAVIWT